MTRERAIRLAEQWSEGGVCTLREGEAQEYHKMCLAALREQEERSKVVTQADRIRTMSDEELAEFIVSHSFAVIGCSRTAWIDYLKQPVKEDV